MVHIAEDMRISALPFAFPDSDVFTVTAYQRPDGTYVVKNRFQRYLTKEGRVVSPHLLDIDIYRPWLEANCYMSRSEALFAAQKYVYSTTVNGFTAEEFLLFQDMTEEQIQAYVQHKKIASDEDRRAVQQWLTLTEDDLLDEIAKTEKN